MDEALKYIPSKFHKDIPLLKVSASKAKNAAKQEFQKQVEEYLDKFENLKPEEHVNYSWLKKLNGLKHSIDVISELSEIDIVTFGLSYEDRIGKKVLKWAKGVDRSLELKMKVLQSAPLSIDMALLKRSQADTVQDKVTLNNQGEGDNRIQGKEKVANNKTLSTVLDEETLINEIFKMRCNVEFAKNYEIRNLTYVLRRPCYAKAELKSKPQQRVVNVIQKIKELDPNEVSIFALSTVEYLPKLSKAVNLPVKTIAMAKVAHNWFVDNTVYDFKTRFPNWRKDVPSILKKIDDLKLNKKTEGRGFEKEQTENDGECDSGEGSDEDSKENCGKEELNNSYKNEDEEKTSSSNDEKTSINNCKSRKDSVNRKRVKDLPKPLSKKKKVF